MLFQIDIAVVRFNRIEYDDFYVLQLLFADPNGHKILHSNIVKKLELFPFDTQFQIDATPQISEDRPDCLDIRIINGFEIDVVRALESGGVKVTQIG